MGKSNSSQRLKALMQIQNINQSDIVEKTGLPKSAVSMYVNGKRLPPQDKLTIIADAFNVDEVWLMGYDVPMLKDKAEQITDYMVDILDDENLLSVSHDMKLMDDESKKRLASYAKFLLNEQKEQEDN